MRRIMVLGNAHRPGVSEEAARLLPMLREHVDVVLVDLLQEADLTHVDAELTLVFGGDGAILRAARQMGYRQLPVLGVNMGRLGFLADLSADELCEYFPRLVQGGYSITEHLMFEALRRDAGDRSLVAPAVAGPQRRRHPAGAALPDARPRPDRQRSDRGVLRRGRADRQHAGRLDRALALGGRADPLPGVVGVRRDADLPARPDEPAARRFGRQRVHRRSSSRGDGAVLIVDGQERIAMPVGSRVSVRRAPVAFKLARVAGRSYYRNLHDKLHWGMQPSLPRRTTPARRAYGRVTAASTPVEAGDPALMAIGTDELLALLHSRPRRDDARATPAGDPLDASSSSSAPRGGESWVIFSAPRRFFGPRGSSSRLFVGIAVLRRGSLRPRPNWSRTAARSRCSGRIYGAVFQTQLTLDLFILLFAVLAAILAQGRGHRPVGLPRGRAPVGLLARPAVRRRRDGASPSWSPTSRSARTTSW